MASKKPVFERRLGCVKAVVWENETPKGTRHNVVFTRLYKDGDEWKETSSFGRDDCLLLAQLAQLVSVQIYELAQQQADQAPTKDAA